MRRERKSRSLVQLLIAILLLVLTVFLAGCTTVKVPSNEDIDAVLQNIAPTKPPAPVMEQVLFEDKDGGLWLRYEAYRTLERNIIALKDYTARLEAIIDFWEGK